MPTILPRRVLRSGSVLDVMEINEDYQTPAEKRSGRLDQHDFSSSIRPSLSVATGAYYSHYYNTATADWNVGTPGAYMRPSTANGLAIPSSGEWTVVGGMSRTVTTGTALLKINARLHWIWQVHNGGIWAGAVDIGAGHVQFAIAVDGQVLPWTVTGEVDTGRKPPWSIKPRYPQRVYGTTMLPGSHQPRSEMCTALGRDMGSERLAAILVVPPGSHTIEVYCRRLRRLATAYLISSGAITDGGIYIYNRQMFTQVWPMLPTTASSFDGVDIAAMEPQDTFSAASMQTARVSALVNAYNAIAPGGLARGALNHNHLPSPLRDWAQATITPASQVTTDDYYPGFSSSTLAGARSGSTGWWLLEDGAGVNLRTDQTHPAVFSNTLDSTYLVLANVQTRHVDNVPQEPHSFGVLAIGYRQGGVTSIIQDTQTLQCNWNYWGQLNGTPALLNEEEDAPLMAVLSVPAGSADIDWFGVYGSAFDDSGARAVLTWQRGCITVFQFRDQLTA